ncbi:CSEP0258 putative effector protein [Blumeria hordei DH14]|uniref:CSEP0258 putative effector protein n=1 Tax=Blumeria graminis f. sp. hordei (strain DH14) TaxID=546991 RepID=N1JDM0_BLUG1|nr:CSEP0258 putative effector protein [Blumeria hordei DH14]
MIAWTVLSILALSSSCFAKPASRKSHTEVFKCRDEFISMVQAQKAVDIGCRKMQFAPPTSPFPASFSESELFGLTNIGLFTWPVFPSDSTSSEDYGLNRVVFDSSCQLIGLIHLSPNGPEPCLHLMEGEDLETAYKLEIYNAPWKNLPLYGYKFENEIYLNNEVEDFVKSNLEKFHRGTYKQSILDNFPSEVNEKKASIWTCLIRRGPTGIEIPKNFFNRRLIINSVNQIVGIARKAWKGWRPFGELRSLDDAYRTKIFQQRKPEMGNDNWNDVNFRGIHLSGAMLKSNLQIACKIITERMIGINSIEGYPSWTNLETISDQPVLTWPLRMPETFFHEDSNSNAAEMKYSSSAEKSDTLFYEEIERPHTKMNEKFSTVNLQLSTGPSKMIIPLNLSNKFIKRDVDVQLV